jgi:hypothetical protein
MNINSKNAIAFVSVILPCLAAAVSAHEHGSSGMTTDMGGVSEPLTSHTNISTLSNSTDMGPPSYFRHPEYSSLMMGHILLMSAGWIFVLPLGELYIYRSPRASFANITKVVMLSIAQSRLNLLAHLVFLTLNAFGILLATIYNSKTPDLYPNNVHHKLGWVLAGIICIEACAALINVYNRPIKGSGSLQERTSFLPISVQAIAEHQRRHDSQINRDPHWSSDDGQGSAPTTESLRSHSMTSTMCDENQDFTTPNYDNDDDVDLEKPNPSKVDFFLSKSLVAVMSRRTFRTLNLIHNIINRLILMLGFIGVTTGVVTYAGIFVSLVAPGDE